MVNTSAVLSLPTFKELRQHVLDILCAIDHLDVRQTHMTEKPITRAGRPCGLFYHVRGPRQLFAYAIWAGEENRILFYNSTGQRFAETKLSEGPDPTQMIEKSKKAA
ncbi:MAG: hypothetical protein ACJ8FY_19715 [Gemmataceae bacterium]